MRAKTFLLAVALGALTVSACETATDPIVGRSPSAPPPDTTDAASAVFSRAVIQPAGPR